MKSNIRKYVSRYVVPFYFSYENDGYEKVRDYFSKNTNGKQTIKTPEDGHWIKAGFWENYKSNGETQAEMDIYSYLPSIFLKEENTEKDVLNLGDSFVYKTDGILFELVYSYTEERKIAIKCTNLGILLFRNCIGFIWYEIAFGNKKSKISLDEYVGFQHDFKELARTKGEKFEEKIYDKEAKKVIYEPFCLGIWLSKILAADTLGIRFWAERKTTVENENKIRIPDKALLYQYLFVDRVTDGERNNLLFQIANGYNEKYNAPENLDESLYKPFGNTSFYVTKAGLACVVRNTDSNESFFDGQFKGKFVRDYFFLYILLAYQSYSCAHYSRLLTKLPSDMESYDKETEYAERLESLDEQINLFLVKSVFESVSNIHHQNGVYRYAKSALFIEEDIRSLTIGLDAIEELVKDKRKQKEKKEKETEREEREERYRLERARKEEEKEQDEKRDRKINRALTIFGIMAVVSVLLDGLTLVNWFLDNYRALNLGHIAVIVGIVLFILYLIFVFLWNRKKKKR